MEFILKKKVNIILLKYLLLFIFAIFLGCEDPSSNKPDIIKTEPEIITNAPKLFEEYKENEIAADAKYKNKIIIVVGMVNNIGKDILDKPYISLWVDKYSITGVQCFIQQSEMNTAYGLKKGDYVSCKGRCTGKFMNIMLENCLVQKLPPPEQSKKKKRRN